MDSPKLKIPKSFYDNFDTVVKYQNVQLIKAICEFKGWDKDREEEITRCFFNGETPETKLKPSKVESVKEMEKPKVKRLIRKKANNHIRDKVENEKIVYIQKPIEVDGIKYLLEDPTNNVYNAKSNKFVGIYYIDNSGLGKINTRLQEN